MKTIIISLLLVSVNAFATIDGPSCGDLTAEQEGYLADAALNYAYGIPKNGALISLGSDWQDCHDYDGVVSGVEFFVAWKNAVTMPNGEVLEQVCTVDLEVDALYDGDEKFVEKDTKYEVKKTSEILCSPDFSEY